MGFALVVTVSLMVLLTVIGLGLLSLSVITLRASGAGRAQQEARANARLALMIAIGELQKHAGPDQRVTADADIVKDVAEDKRHLMGVWSTEEWDPEEPEKKRALIAWLATLPDADPEEPTLDDVRTPLPSASEDMVALAGPGSLGEDADEVDHVRVATVPIHAGPGTLDGSYAYWVRGEASRASYAVPTEAKPLAWNAASHGGVATRTGIETLDEDLFADYPELAEEVAGYAPSTQSMDALHPARPKASQTYFHHLTNRSLSLLTNTRHGGDKSDLSTAFELDAVSKGADSTEGFNELPEFHDSSERNITNGYDLYGSGVYNKHEFYPESHPLGYLFVIPPPTHNFGSRADSVVRGPTWDLLRNHYRVYKREWDEFNWPRSFKASDDDAFVARGTLPLSYAGRAWGQHRSPGSWYHRGFDKWAPSCNIAEPLLDGKPQAAGSFAATRYGSTQFTAARIQPMVVRITVVVGLRKKRIPNASASQDSYQLVLSMDPYVTIVNPYNRPIEFEALGVKAIRWNPLRFRFTGQDSKGKPIDQRERQFGDSGRPPNAQRGALALYLPPPSGSGAHRLEPGEVKVLSPDITGGVQEFHNKSRNLVRLSFDYTENSGLYAVPWIEGGKGGEVPIIPKDNITVATYGRMYLPELYDPIWGDTFHVLQVSPRGHDGRGLLETELSISRDLKELYGDKFDDQYIARIGYSTKDLEAPNYKEHEFYVERRYRGLGEVPEVGKEGKYMVALDLRMKHGSEGPTRSRNGRTQQRSTPVFHQFSPRAQNFDPRIYDTTNRIDPSWVCEIKRVDDMIDLGGMVGDSEGHGYWGNGMSTPYGTDKVVLFDLPWAPMTSLGSLSSADTTLISAGAASAIGNSFPNPGLRDLTSIAGKRVPPGEAALPSPNYGRTTEGSQALADYSWAANETLWDQYFFSGINWGDAPLAYEKAGQTHRTQTEAVEALIESARTGENPLANPRMLYIPGTSEDPTEDLKDYSRIARHLAILGGFNVNSTSVEAWAAVLSAHRDQEIKFLGDSGRIDEEETSASFSRFMLPAGDSGDIWSGFRELDDDDIHDLAEAIVEQVKVRGPFMGMADFVNRRLTKKSVDGFDIGKLGALQMAIESAGLNDSIQREGTEVQIRNMENTTIGIGDGSRMTVNTLTGIPGYLMQADVLTTLGSILRTRSDTFLIRAYGDAKDSKGKVLARAWCEATIQRSPDWVVPTDEPFKTKLAVDPDRDMDETPILEQWETNDEFPEDNRLYGRKMRLVSFRWLSKDEV